MDILWRHELKNTARLQKGPWPLWAVVQIYLVRILSDTIVPPLHYPNTWFKFFPLPPFDRKNFGDVHIIHLLHRVTGIIDVDHWVIAHHQKLHYAITPTCLHLWMNLKIGAYHLLHFQQSGSWCRAIFSQSALAMVQSILMFFFNGQRRPLLR